MIARRVILECGVGAEDLDQIAEPVQQLGVAPDESIRPENGD
jgi:hypothetical protein